MHETSLVDFLFLLPLYSPSPSHLLSGPSLSSSSQSLSYLNQITSHTMYQLLLSVSLFLSVVAAETMSAVTPAITSGTSSGACISAAVLDACLSTTQNLVSICGSTDYPCMCQRYIDIVQ